MFYVFFFSVIFFLIFFNTVAGSYDCNQTLLHNVYTNINGLWPGYYEKKITVDLC